MAIGHRQSPSSVVTVELCQYELDAFFGGLLMGRTGPYNEDPTVWDYLRFMIGPLTCKMSIAELLCCDLLLVEFWV